MEAEAEAEYAPLDDALKEDTVVLLNDDSNIENCERWRDRFCRSLFFKFE